MHQSFINFRNYRYGLIAGAASLLTIAAYILDRPRVPPNGGTWLGYTLGTIAALIILWLTWFGWRKRAYDAPGRVQAGWLSAHVYLGTSLIFIVLLHTGFDIHWNLHTFTFVLMLVVIFSGFFGMYVYLRYPTLMTRNRESATRVAMLDEIAEIDQNALSLADGIDPKIHAIVLRSIENTRLGGSVWTQLRAQHGSDIALDSLQASMAERDKSKETPTGEQATMFAMVDFLAGRAVDKQSEALRKLIDMISRKKRLATRVARDIQYQAMMEIWLYFHVPISFALLAALIAHIVSSFFYW